MKKISLIITTAIASILFGCSYYYEKSYISFETEKSDVMLRCQVQLEGSKEGRTGTVSVKPAIIAFSATQFSQIIARDIKIEDEANNVIFEANEMAAPAKPNSYSSDYSHFSIIKFGPKEINFGNLYFTALIDILDSDGSSIQTMDITGICQTNVLKYYEAIPR